MYRLSILSEEWDVCNGLQGWVDCFEKASLKGMVGGGGIDAANTAADHVDAMKKAYELGKKL